MLLNKELWIGLANIVPARDENMLEANDMGAYTTVVATATKRIEFAQRANAFFKEQGVHLVELTEVETYAERIARCQLRAELQALARWASENDSIWYDDLYFYPLNDEGQTLH